MKKVIGKKVKIKKHGGIYSGGTIVDVKRDDKGIIRYKVDGDGGDKWYMITKLYPRPDGSTVYAHPYS